MSDELSKTGEGTRYTIISIDTAMDEQYGSVDMYVAKYDGIYRVSGSSIALIRRLHWWNRWWYKLLHRGERR